MVTTWIRIAPDFALVDVETANGRQVSICHVEAGTSTDRWQTLIAFRARVDGAPVWPDVFPEVQQWLSGLVVSSGLLRQGRVAESLSELWSPSPAVRGVEGQRHAGATYLAGPIFPAGYALHKLAADFDLGTPSS